jgi:hypothetical protein
LITGQLREDACEEEPGPTDIGLREADCGGQPRTFCLGSAIGSGKRARVLVAEVGKAQQRDRSAPSVRVLVKSTAWLAKVASDR